MSAQPPQENPFASPRRGPSDAGDEVAPVAAVPAARRLRERLLVLAVGRGSGRLRRRRARLLGDLTVETGLGEVLAPLGGDWQGEAYEAFRERMTELVAAIDGLGEVTAATAADSAVAGSRAATVLTKIAVDEIDDQIADHDGVQTPRRKRLDTAVKPVADVVSPYVKRLGPLPGLVDKVDDWIPDLPYAE